MTLKLDETVSWLVIWTEYSHSGLYLIQIFNSEITIYFMSLVARALSNELLTLTLLHMPPWASILQ